MGEKGKGKQNYELTKLFIIIANDFTIGIDRFLMSTLQ